VFDKSWKSTFGGITLHAVNYARPWMLAVVDYRALLDLHWISRGWPRKASYVWAMIDQLHSHYRHVDTRKIELKPRPRVELYYRDHYDVVHYVGYIIVRSRDH